MRFALALVLLGAISSIASAQDAMSIDRQINESLREVHDRGADLYNNGDVTGGYRMYQGGLVVARAALAHRPGLQKTIADGLTAAERQPSVSRRAFLLHELIEQVRTELRTSLKKGPEPLTIPPREVNPGGKSPVKPAAGVGEVKGGVVGRVIWQNKPIEGVEVTFVSLGRLEPRVYETTTGAQGVYEIKNLSPGKYIVLIVPGPKSEIRKLPERYSTTTTSPLRIDAKGDGEKLDFLLQ